MSLKRRQFLFFGGSLCLSLVGIRKLLWGQLAESAEARAEVLTPAEAAAIASLSLSQPAERFISVADTGMGNRGQYQVAAAMNRYRQQSPFNLVILAGDNIYNNGDIQKVGKVFEQPYRPLLDAGVKFQACLGNHDIGTENGDRQVQYPGFNMPDRYYTFRRDRLQFFALDTNRNADWKAQLPWLEKELSRSDAPWKIVFGHHAIYSSGLHGGNQKLRQRLTPLFQKYGVCLYINGHDHHYERTRSVNGTIYLTCGAGAETRPVGRSPLTARSASRLSFAAFDVYPAHIVISAIDADNNIFDQGVIQMQSGSIPLL